MALKDGALSLGLAAARAGSNALAQNPEKDNAFAMQVAMPAHRDKMTRGAKELFDANAAKTFMDSSKASN